MVGQNDGNSTSGSGTISASTLNLGDAAFFGANKTVEISGSKITFDGSAVTPVETASGDDLYASAFINAGVGSATEGTITIASGSVNGQNVKSTLTVNDGKWGALYANTIEVSDTDIKIGSGATFIMDGDFAGTAAQDEGTHDQVNLTLEDVTFDNQGTAIIGNPTSGGEVTVQSGTTTLTGNIKNYAQITISGSSSDPATLVISENQLAKPAADATDPSGLFAGKSGSVVLSGDSFDGAVLKLVGTDADGLDLLKDITLTSGDAVAYGQIGVDGSGTIAGEHLVLTGALNGKIGDSNKLALEADILEIGTNTTTSKLSTFSGAEQFTAHDDLVLRGSGDTFTIDKLIYTVTDVVANTAEVTGYESGLAGEVDIPATITYASKTYTVTSIGKRAFEECEAITTVTIPEGVTNIGLNAFYGCTALTAVTIPNSMTSIEEKAFYGCKALEAITIPAGMTSIGYSAFYGCTALTAVTIPASVTSIENLVFGNCTSLTQINVDAANTVYSSENGVLFNKDKTTLICYPAGKPETDYTVPDGVTTIGENAFAYAIFTQITLPESLTAIEYYAFYDCTALTQMTVLATVPPTVASHYVFNNVNYRIPVYVPAESLDDYKEADVWKEFSNLQALQTGLQTPSMPESISLQDGMLHNPQGLHLTLYDMQGRQVYSGNDATVSQPAGVYVVRCAGASCKIVF